MPFTYQPQIDDLIRQGVTCPPASASGMNLCGWRFVWSPVCIRSAVPVALKDPKRFRNKDSYVQCSAWALSMYASEDQCREAFADYEASVPNFRKNAGDHVASVMISSLDGLCTPANRRNGHFDFHPYAHVDVVSKMSLRGPL
ncbi:hypothetical protein D3C81_1849460 [compost metagenome]